jgi:hypothetical protein
MAAAAAVVREKLNSVRNGTATALADLVANGINQRKRWALDLIKVGAVGVNAKGTVGTTALFAACYALWKPAVEALMLMGADAHDVGLKGGNAAQAAFIAAVDRHERLTLPATDTVCVDILNSLMNYGVSLAYCRKTEVDIVLSRLIVAATERGYDQLVAQLMSVVVT